MTEVDEIREDEFAAEQEEEAEYGAAYDKGYNEGMRFNALIEQYVIRREMPKEVEKGFWDAITDGNTEYINVNVPLFMDLFSAVGFGLE